MAHKCCYEALDKSLRDIMRSNNADSLFGGKVDIVFGGDFRQILLVIPIGNHSDIVNATINASYLWQYCHVLKLTKNVSIEWCIQYHCRRTSRFFPVDIRYG